MSSIMQVFKWDKFHIAYLCKTYGILHSSAKVLVPIERGKALSVQKITLQKGQKVCFLITYFNENGEMQVRVIKGGNTLYSTKLKVRSTELCRLTE